MAGRLTGQNPEAQAGFFFALQTLTRSAPHRTIVAIALAAGLTHPLIALAGTRLHAHETASMPLALLGINVMILGPLLAGVRFAVTVPAELPSNWTIQMAWLGDERGYLAGVKHAALVSLVTVPLLVLLPFHAALLGVGAGLVHSLYGFLLANATLDGLFMGYRRMPFACSYVPIENPKLVWPPAVTILLLVPYGFADVERWALQTAAGTMVLGATLVAIVLGIRLVDRVLRRESVAVDFDERPAPATQRLGLFDSG
jgi:hypothetical protein